MSGGKGTGKTALVCKLALECGFPFVKIIHPDDLVGYHSNGKAIKINEVFQDAYKSDLSLIIIDDIERLIEFNHFSGQYSNVILQDLQTNCKKRPPKDNGKIFVLGTTSIPDIMS